MVTLTDKLALRKPAGSDPFLRSDFEYNWELIDDNIYTRAVVFQIATSVDIAVDTSYTQSMGSFTPPYPCEILVFGSVDLNFLNSGPDFSAYPGICTGIIKVDASSIAFGAGAGALTTPRAPDPSAIPSADAAGAVAVSPVFGWAAGVDDSSHALSVTVSNADGDPGGTASEPVTLTGISLTVLYLDYSSP